MLTMYRSVKSNHLTQDFGDNKACVLPNTRPFVFVNCSQPSISLYKMLGMKGHNGYDFACWSGEAVYHAVNFDGWLKHESDLDGGIGVDIVSTGQICRDENGNLQYVKFRVWHGKQVVGKEGQQVKFGDLIMLGDSTGASGGNHVHQALKWCDKEGRGIKNDNGWLGVVPPDLYSFQNTFVGEVTKVEPRKLRVLDYIKMLVLELQMLKLK